LSGIVKVFTEFLLSERHVDDVERESGGQTRKESALTVHHGAALQRSHYDHVTLRSSLGELLEKKRRVSADFRFSIPSPEDVERRVASRPLGIPVLASRYRNADPVRSGGDRDAIVLHRRFKARRLIKCGMARIRGTPAARSPHGRSYLEECNYTRPDHTALALAVGSSSRTRSGSFAGIPRSHSARAAHRNIASDC